MINLWIRDKVLISFLSWHNHTKSFSSVIINRCLYLIRSYWKALKIVMFILPSCSLLQHHIRFINKVHSAMVHQNMDDLFHWWWTVSLQYLTKSHETQYKIKEMTLNCKLYKYCYNYNLFVLESKMNNITNITFVYCEHSKMHFDYYVHEIIPFHWRRWKIVLEVKQEASLQKIAIQLQYYCSKPCSQENHE